MWDGSDTNCRWCRRAPPWEAGTTTPAIREHFSLQFKYYYKRIKTKSWALVPFRKTLFYFRDVLNQEWRPSTRTDWFVQIDCELQSSCVSDSISWLQDSLDLWLKHYSIAKSDYCLCDVIVFNLVMLQRWFVYCKLLTRPTKGVPFQRNYFPLAIVNQWLLSLSYIRKSLKGQTFKALWCAPLDRPTHGPFVRCCLKLGKKIILCHL